MIKHTIKKNLPAWFDLTNYSHFDHSTSLQRILRELRARKYIYNNALKNRHSLQKNENWTKIKNQKSLIRYRRKEEILVYVKDIADVCKQKQNHNLDVRINLYAPTSILLHELSKIINSTRNKNKIKAKHIRAGRVKLDKIISYKIIPLIDLLISEIEDNCRYTNSKLAEIFGIDEAEHIRGPRKKLVKEIMETNLLDELETIIKTTKLHPPKTDRENN